MKTLIKHLYGFRNKSGAAIAILVLTSLSFFWPVWFKGKLPIPADGLVGLYHPFRDYYALNFPNGIPFKNYILTDPVLQQIPWKWLVINGWREAFVEVFKGPALREQQGRALSYIRDNPYNLSGTPLLANIQAGTFYPLNLIFIFNHNFSSAWTAFIIIQPVLSSLFMFWWLKNNGLRRTAAVFGGLVWAFSSFNLVWLEWGNIGHAGLYLPLALLAVDKLKVKSEKFKVQWKWHALLQFSLASSLFAGHFQITFYLLVAVVLYIVFLKRPGPALAGPGLNKLSVFFVHCFLFLTLTFPQWAPAWRFVRESNRSIEQADVLSREGFFIRPRQLVQLIAPDFFGNPSTLNYRGDWNYAEQIIYIGIIPLLFVLLGVFHVVDSQRYSVSNLQGFGWTLAVFGLLFAVDNPISRLPYQLKFPLVSDLQPTRLAYLITFGLSIVSSVGLNEFIKSPKKSLSRIMTISIIIATLLFALIVISSKFSPIDKLISQRNLIFPFITLGAVALTSVGFRIFPNKIYPLLTTFYFLFSISDLFRFGWKFTPFSPKEYLYPVTPSIKFLQENMGINDRYMTLDRRLLPPNANIMYKLKSIEGYDPIYSKAYAGKIAGMENGNEIIPDFGRIIRPVNFRSPVARELNVKYVLSLEDVKDPSLEKVFQEGETRIYEMINN